ncbi:hypothetical protein HID58_068613 [Brassica napus]|uniref:Uncharacterized protein n=1 Tax=Brassica napus TaxID=3708 RepID=A0ABQ7ZLV5_BRANA|nr:hypothetical protein HID58_068613 [Brassica napus]
MQSGIFKSSLFFLSFITLSLHSLLNKRENEVVSVVNTILVVYSSGSGLLLFCLLDPRSSDFFSLCSLAESIDPKLCAKLLFFLCL